MNKLLKDKSNEYTEIIKRRLKEEFTTGQKFVRNILYRESLFTS